MSALTLSVSNQFAYHHHLALLLSIKINNHFTTSQRMDGWMDGWLGFNGI